VYYGSDYEIEGNAPVFRILNKYDIEIDNYSNLQVINTYRYHANRFDSIRKSTNGIMLCDLNGDPCSQFNNYSYLLSKNGMLNLGKHVSLNHAINITAAGDFGYGSVNTNVKWRKPEGSTIASYTYVGWIVWDVQRKIIGMSGESGMPSGVSIGTFTPVRTTENGVSIIKGVSFVANSLGLCGFNCIIRLYRQKNNSTTDIEVCDIPFCGSKTIWDNGLDIDGYPWRAKTTADADNMNNALIASGPIQFIGHNVICHAASQPTSGQWKAGDKVFNTASGSTAFWIYTGSAWLAK
jgi:hypothetical protein